MKTGKHASVALVAAVIAMLVFSCALMTGCNSGSSSGASNAGTSGTTKPAKNGFDEKTNKTVTMGSYSFSIPEYFEENASKSSDTSKVFQVKNGSSVVGEMVLGLEKATGAHVDTIKNASESRIESFLKDHEKTIQKNAASVSDAKNTNIAGYPAKSATFIEKGAGEKWTDSYVVFIDTDAAETFTIIFGTTENADFDYSDDYQKIIDSIAKASSSTSGSGSSASSNEVSPDFKATMDSYEAFFNEYVEFMKEYMEDPTNTKLLSRYSNMLSQYSKTMSAMNAIDKDSLSPADAAYYLEVSSRITKKLSEVL